MKRVIIVFLALTLFLSVFAGDQTACLNEAEQFAMQCYEATGDGAACTQAASELYKQCMVFSGK